MPIILQYLNFGRIETFIVWTKTIIINQNIIFYLRE